MFKCLNKHNTKKILTGLMPMSGFLFTYPFCHNFNQLPIISAPPPPHKIYSRSYQVTNLKNSKMIGLSNKQDNKGQRNGPIK